MIRSNLEAELEAKKKELEELKRDIAIVRVVYKMSEDSLMQLNSCYSDLIYAIENLEEQIEAAKEDYED